MIEKEKPELVLSDISMPEDDRLTNSPRRFGGDQSGTTSVWSPVTGYGQESDKRLAKEAGFNDHLGQPISKTNLECLLCR